MPIYARYLPAALLLFAVITPLAAQEQAADQQLAPGASLQYRLLPKGTPEQRALELKIESADGVPISAVPPGAPVEASGT